PVVMVQFPKIRRDHVAPPAVEVVVDAVALAAPAFLVVAAGIRGEQHAAGLERRVQLPEDPRQLRARDMEERCVGEDAVEAPGRQLEPQEILLEDFAAAVLARHPGEARRAVEADRDVSERLECGQVAPRSTAEVEDGEGRLALDMAQELGDVLADVMLASALPERVGALLVVAERDGTGGMGSRGRHGWVTCMRVDGARMAGSALSPPGRL